MFYYTVTVINWTRPMGTLLFVVLYSVLLTHDNKRRERIWNKCKYNDVLSFMVKESGALFGNVLKCKNNENNYYNNNTHYFLRRFF